MELETIYGYVLSALGGGGITGIVKWIFEKKKAKVEIKQSEVEVIAETVRSVYEPIIEQQNKRIAELDREVKELRQEKRDQKDEYEKQIAAMKKDYQEQIASLEARMLGLAKAVGYRATSEIKSSTRRAKAANQTED